MTEPRRHTADTITDDELDALYARIATLEGVCRSNKRAYVGAVQDCQAAEQRAEQAEAAIARVRAWCDQLDSNARRLSWSAPVHPVAANVRHFLDQPKET
ncbi:hypothetical protein [Streptomyces sp. NPDC101132]|uniref:hypothetical protein n=1 Tax=Streptomyces sp. NPDC101132 TaxID=3366110 RepID=UPI00381F96F2